MIRRWLLVAAVALVAAAASAQTAAPVGIEQNLGAQLPLSLRFTEADGSSAPLSRDLGPHPAVLMFGYCHCRNLCDTSLDSLARAVMTAPLHAGSDAEILFLSIDPQETPQMAAAKQAAYEKAFPQSRVGRWHFLTGQAEAIATLARAAGFRYAHDAKTDTYVHAAGVVLLTPQGRISRYLPGVAIDPAALRAGVLGAGHGRIGALAASVLVLCEHFGQHLGARSAAVLQGIRWLCLACALGFAGWIIRSARRRAAAEDGNA